MRQHNAERQGRIDRIRELCEDLSSIEGIRDAWYEDSTNDYYDIDINVRIVGLEEFGSFRPRIYQLRNKQNLRSLSQKVRAKVIEHGGEHVTVRSPRRAPETVKGFYLSPYMNVNLYSI